MKEFLGYSVDDVAARFIHVPKNGGALYFKMPKYWRSKMGEIRATFE